MASRSIDTVSTCRPAGSWAKTGLRRTGVLITIALLAAGGCGRRVPHSDRPWAQVTVVVSVGADPLAEGEVAFLAAEGSDGVDAGGVVDAKGTVAFPVLPGDYTVVIRPLPPSEEEMARPRTGPKAAPPRVTSIPGRFHSPKTSPFKATLSAREKRAFSFDLAAPSEQ